VTAGEAVSVDMAMRSPGQGQGFQGKFGNVISWANGLDFQVDITGTLSNGQAQLVSPTVTGLGDGKYIFNYTLDAGESSGCGFTTSQTTVQLFVELFGAYIPGSPFQLNLVAGLPKGSAMIASPTYNGLPSGIVDAVQGFTTYFLVLARDQFGNPVLTGNLASNFTVLVNQMPTTYSVTKQNGGYLISYVAPSASSFQLSVLYAGTNINGSPFTVTGLDNLNVSTSTEFAIIGLDIAVAVVLLVLVLMILINRHKEAIRDMNVVFHTIVFIASAVALGSAGIPASPSNGTCMAFPWLLGCAFSVVVTAVIVRNWRFKPLFSPFTDKLSSDQVMLLVVLCALVLEVFFDALWTGLDPLIVTVTPSQFNPLVTYQSCTSRYLVAWEGVTYGTKAAWLLFGLGTAFVTTKKFRFHEDKLLIVVLYNISTCSVLGLILCYTIKDDPSAVYIVRNLMIICASAFTALALVAPRLLWNKKSEQSIDFSLKPYHMQHEKNYSSQISPQRHSRTSRAEEEHAVSGTDGSAHKLISSPLASATGPAPAPASDSEISTRQPLSATTATTSAEP